MIKKSVFSSYFFVIRYFINFTKTHSKISQISCAITKSINSQSFKSLSIMILILYLFFKLHFTIVELLSNKFKFMNDIVIISFIAILIKIILFSNFHRISFFQQFRSFQSFWTSNSFWRCVLFYYSWSNVLWS